MGGLDVFFCKVNNVRVGFFCLGGPRDARRKCRHRCRFWMSVKWRRSSDVGPSVFGFFFCRAARFDSLWIIHVFECHPSMRGQPNAISSQFAMSTFVCIWVKTFVSHLDMRIKSSLFGWLNEVLKLCLPWCWMYGMKERINLWVVIIYADTVIPPIEKLYADIKLTHLRLWNWVSPDKRAYY